MIHKADVLTTAEKITSQPRMRSGVRNNENTYYFIQAFIKADTVYKHRSHVEHNNVPNSSSRRWQ